MKIVSLVDCLPRFGPVGCRVLGFGSLIGMGAAALFAATPVRAAERVVFTFGPLGRSIPVADLQALAETGQTTRQIRWYLNVANLEVETLQQVLTQEVGVSLRLVDRVGNSLPGEFVLDQVGNTLHTKSRQANVQALRSALVLSLSDDNQLSLLEFLQNYPTQELYVDGRSLLSFARDVQGIVNRVEPIVAAVQTVLEGLVCDCEPARNR